MRVASVMYTLDDHEGGESDLQGDGCQDGNHGVRIVPR